MRIVSQYEEEYELDLRIVLEYMLELEEENNACVLRWYIKNVSSTVDTELVNYEDIDFYMSLNFEPKEYYSNGSENPNYELEKVVKDCCLRYIEDNIGEGFVRKNLSIDSCKEFSELLRSE